MNWHDKKEVKKGSIGEEIVRNFLEDKGFILYRPVTEGAHKIDYFAHSGRGKKVICCEVKTKRRMVRYEKTGFNLSSFVHYKEIYDKHNIDTFIFFIDDFERCIYGQWLSKLSEGEIKGNFEKVIVWNLTEMKKIINLNDMQVNELTKHTTVNYDYSKVRKFFVK